MHVRQESYLLPSVVLRRGSGDAGAPVQRYLGLFERKGDLQSVVEVNRESRMATGLIVQFLVPLRKPSQRRRSSSSPDDLVFIRALK